MIESLTILNRVLVKEFYRLNAGFFLLIITLTFGFMSGIEHRALAEMFVSSWQLLFIPFAVWTIYLIKVVNFNIQRLELPENSFLFEMQLLNARNKFLSTFVAINNQFVPAMAYGAFLILTAVKNDLYISAFQTGGALMILTILGSFFFLYKIQNREKEIRITALKRFIDYRFTRSLPQFYLEWVLRREPVLCFATKVFSCILIVAISALYRFEVYDARLMSMASVLVFASNMMIVNQLHRFENLYFPQLRSAPFAIARRIGQLMIVLLVLCAPELIFLTKYLPDHLSLMTNISIAIFGISIVLLFYALIFLKLLRENFSRVIFGLSILWIFLVLCGVPPEILAAANILASILIYRTHYYRFEYGADELD